MSKANVLIMVSTLVGGNTADESADLSPATPPLLHKGQSVHLLTAVH